MRVEVDKVRFGNYGFIVELDTGAETGANQRTVWFAEKLAVEMVPLSRFQLHQLLKALLEPHRSSLQTQLDAEQRACRRPFEEEIARLKRVLSQEGAAREQRASIKRRMNNLYRQMNNALQRLNTDFTRRNLLVLDRQHFDNAVLQQENQMYGEHHFLRDFYFEETNTKYIHNFCRKIALDETYRQQVLAGEIPWAKRNALFVRNLPTALTRPSTARDNNEQDMHDFFRWISANFESILALPEYQYLQQLDNAFKADAKILDPLIRQAVELLNMIPGVVTQYSCQGVSGKVYFAGRSLLAVSEHEEFAYVSFSALEQPGRSIIEALLPTLPSITNITLPFNFALRSVLRSTGDNLRFRAELLSLAQRALEQVSDNL